jgi:hypothetical protein
VKRSGITRWAFAGFAAGLLALGVPLVPPLSSLPPAGAVQPSSGYWEVAADGGIFSFGNATFYGSMGGSHLNEPIVSMAATPYGEGYWLVASDGGVFAYGDALFYGSAATLTLTAPIVGITSTPDGRGYWLVGADGGVFAFGDAGFYGSWPSQNPQSGGSPPRPFIGLVSSSDGRGYTLANQSGTGEYWYGDYGTCNVAIEGPLSAEHTAAAAVGAIYYGNSCWVASSDGGVYTGGHADFQGSMGGRQLNAPIVGMALSPDDGGYWLAASDGGVFAFGDAAFQGSMGGTALNEPIVGIAPT